jgi:hypothetical protein
MPRHTHALACSHDDSAARTAHTPGPWKMVTAPANSAPSAPLEAEIRGEGNHVVARLGTLHHDTAKANARLIAAAPELLAALEAAFIALGKCGGNRVGGIHRAEWELARAAIAKVGAK